MSEIIQINEGTWRLEDNGVRFFLLTGTQSALLIDSGMRTPNARALAESITSLPLQLINTHADPDHISGNSAFDTIMMHPLEESLYRKNGGSGTILPMQGGDIIDLGDRPIKIIDLPGHTPGSIALLDIAHRALIGGDSIQNGRIFMFGAHRNMELYIESMSELSAHMAEFDIIYPSHSSFPVYPDIIPELIQAARQVLAGQASGTLVDMFGKQVMLYQFDAAGFLYEES